jgi:hypothetical protein
LGVVQLFSLGGTSMSLFPIILTALVLLLLADFVRWKIVVGRELKRRDLVRVGTFGIRITPARGFRFIEACTCERDGKEYRVVIMNHGWLRTQPSFEIVEI